MKSMTPFFLALCLGILFHSSSAQGNLSIQIGPTFPTGDFADDALVNDDDAGGAGIGLGIGAHYLYPLSVEGLHLFGSLNINYFELKKEVKEDLEDQAINNADVKFGRYFSIPLSAGLSYQFDLEGNIPVYAHLGLALNFLKPTPTVYEGNNVETSIRYDVSSTVGVKIGVGVFLNENLFLEANFYGLGEHDGDGEIENTGLQDIRFDDDQQVSYFTLGVGFLLDP